jgi:hypothetical protein
MAGRDMRAFSKIALRGSLLLGAALLPILAVAAGQADAQGSVMQAAEQLKPGDYIWAPEVAPNGPLLMIVSLASQRATLYRNGVPIAITTVSTGKAGYETPTGIFTILQRAIEHYSSLYDNAPMPYIQRLTWGGVALHGGSLPGYPASHGCIRLPQEFARLLYGVTRLGMTVIVTDATTVPRAAPADPLLRSGTPMMEGTAMWSPERSPNGPVSIIISAADHRILVLRNGIVIGSASAGIDGPMTGTSAFLMQAGEAGTASWLEISIPGVIAAAVPTHFAGRVHVADAVRGLIAPLLVPGTSIIITPDSLRDASPAPVELLGGNEDIPPAR